MRGLVEDIQNYQEKRQGLRFKLGKNKGDTTMPTITIDGKEYDSDQLSEEAKQQLGSIQFVDKKIEELKNEIAVYQTARNGYARALSEMLDKQ